jgi:hypothetical protein
MPLMQKLLLGNNAIGDSGTEALNLRDGVHPVVFY